MFHFEFSHALELSGTMVTSRHSKELGWQSCIEPWITDFTIEKQVYHDVVYVLPNQAGTDFELSIPMDIVCEAGTEKIEVELRFSQVTYQTK